MTAAANWQSWKEREAAREASLSSIEQAYIDAAMRLLMANRTYDYHWPSPESWDALAKFTAAPAQTAGAPLAGAGAASEQCAKADTGPASAGKHGPMQAPYDTPGAASSDEGAGAAYAAYGGAAHQSAASAGHASSCAADSLTFNAPSESTSRPALPMASEDAADQRPLLGPDPASQGRTFTDDEAMRRAAKVDANQAEVVQALRNCGAEVLHLHSVGKGCPDVLCGYRGINYLFEIKADAKAPYTADQLKWQATWPGKWYRINSVADALCVLTGTTR